MPEAQAVEREDAACLLRRAGCATEPNPDMAGAWHQPLSRTAQWQKVTTSSTQKAGSTCAGRNKGMALTHAMRGYSLQVYA